MKKTILILTAFLLGTYAFAQQALWGGASVESPVVNGDGTVTFRYMAPGAEKITVSGDFLPTQKVQTPYGEFDAPGTAELIKKEKGVWEYTTDFKVAPEMYTYTFNVDGQTVIDNNNMWVNRDVSSLTSAFIAPGERADLYMINDVPHGTVLKVWYESSAAGFDRRLSVYLPAGYDPCGNTRYPVVYVLHGIGGDEDAWLAQGRAAQILDNLIAQGKAKPMIAVFTNGNISQEAAPGENSTGYTHPTMQLPKTMEGTFETSFHEIVNFIDTNFKTVAEKEGRAICGLSMGGFHTLYISLNNPDMFNWSGLFSAAIGVSDTSISPIYQDFDEKLAKYFSKKPALFWIGCGNTDFLIQANKDFVAKLDAAGYPHEYYENDGGHIWRNWRIYFTEFIPKLFK